MRVFITAIIILAVIISGIVCNTIYMERLTTQMLDIISNLPEHSDLFGDTSLIQELYNLWETNRKIVAINANSCYITDITTALIDVEKYYTSEYDAQYQAARGHLYQAIYRLHELEKFSFDNII